MNVTEAVSFALGSLRANKLRAGLTILGMMIGTASIIFVVTIAVAGRAYILQQIEGVGNNLIYLYHEPGGALSSQTLADDLTQEDLAAVAALPDVASATGIRVHHERVSIGGKEREVTIIGVTPEYRQVRNLRVRSGRFLDGVDERSYNKVCLLTEELARKMFGSLEVRGKSLKLYKVRFQVIGVFREGVETFGQSEVSTFSALVPMSVMRQFTVSDKMDQIYVSARSSESVPEVTLRIQDLLKARHRAGSLYRVENLAEILSAANRIAGALTIVLFLIGAISIVISGIGIMNIMLVTVTERTREIGIKMALGARRREILTQFLAESIFMAAAGGGVGVVLGLAGPLAARWFAGIDTPVSGISILIAFSMSLLVGVASGYVPANRAAKLNPTEALRYE